MKSTIAVIDFGTSKVVTLIATAEGYDVRSCNIHGVGSVPYEGFYNGDWNNSEEIVDVVSQSIELARQNAGIKNKISEIYIGVPGEFTDIRVFNVSLNIQDPEPRIKAEHIDKIFELAEEKYEMSTSSDLGDFNATQNMILHRTAAWFMVDNGKKTLEPVNQKGRELSAMVCYILANDNFREYMSKLMEVLKIKVLGFSSSLLGLSSLCIPEHERDNMAALIDVGYLNTDFIIAEGDAIIYHKTIPIGGGHVSAALASRFDVPLKSVAETLKRQFEFNLDDPEKEYEINASEGARPYIFKHSDVEAEVLPVVDALCEEIQNSIDESGCRLTEKSSVYLSGGGLALNKGGREYISNKLNRSVREPAKKVVRMQEPFYASSMGLMHTIFMELRSGNLNDSGIKGFIKKLFNV